MSRVSRPTEYIRLTGKYIKGTEKAMLFRVDAVSGVEVTEPKTHWFPRSQLKSSISKVSEIDGEKDMIEAADWVCREKELQ